MISKDTLNELNDIVNSTWGKSSGDGTMSLTCGMEGDNILVTYQTVVHFASEQSLRMQVDRLVLESNELISKKIADLKKRCKETSEDTLKFEEVSSNDDIELISSSVHNPRKVAIYRRRCSLQVQ